MAATIIYLVISLLVSLIFIILGIMQYRSEKPVSINTGEKPLRKEELTNVTEWNHRHGRNFIIWGCVLFITQAVFIRTHSQLSGTSKGISSSIHFTVPSENFS